MELVLSRGLLKKDPVVVEKEDSVGGMEEE